VITPARNKRINRIKRRGLRLLAIWDMRMAIPVHVD